MKGEAYMQDEKHTRWRTCRVKDVYGGGYASWMTCKGEGHAW